MTYDIQIDIDAFEFLQKQDTKTRNIIKNNLEKLEEQPYPSPQAQTGDREKVTVNGEEVYRMHISRSYTAFYTINKNDQEIIVTDILDIGTAHKLYD